MILRRSASLLPFLLALPVAILLVGCSALQTISIRPAQGSTTLTAIGQTAQFTAFGVSQMGSGEPTTANITNSVTWTSSNNSVATINAAGLATAVGAGYAQIYATSGGVDAASDITVSIGGSGTSGTPSITIVPSTATSTFVGETTQFLATGSLTGGAPQNLTNQVQWVSTNVQVASISSSGLATAVAAGTTTIIAEYGGLNATATLTVTISAAASNATLVLIPTSGTATFAGETTQFIALGNLTGGVATQNLTGNVTWTSSDVSVATVDQNGLATAVAANVGTPETTTITAIGSTTGGSLITATATLSVQPAGGSLNLSTLAVYMAGTGTGTVVSSPGTIACGSSVAGATCSGTFSLGTTVTLTAAPAAGSVFGGWSSGCTPSTGNPLVCTVMMNNNKTVGAIFNP